ncbi:MAG: M56 family metallopeptidase, partial [Verrucomicrobiota bacterium]
MSALQIFITEIDPLLVGLWKTTLILVAAGLLQIVLRRYHPRWQVTMWRAAFIAVIAMLSASVLLPSLEMKIAPEMFDRKAAAPSEATGGLPEGLASAVVPFPEIPSPTINLPVSYDESVQRDLRGTLLTIWLLGIIVFAAPWFRRYVALRRLRTEAVPAPSTIGAMTARIGRQMDLSGQTEVRVHKELPGPCSVSVRAPLILLPDPGDPDLDAILAHELAHIRSRDLLWAWLMDAFKCVLWFHPLVWHMRREHLYACELASDAAAVDFLSDRESYSSTLARIALRVCGHRQSLLPAVGMARTSDVVRRLRQIKAHLHDTSPQPWRTRLFTTFTITLAVMAGAVHFTVADEGKKTKPPVSKRLQTNIEKHREDRVLPAGSGGILTFRSMSGSVVINTHREDSIVYKAEYHAVGDDKDLKRELVDRVEFVYGSTDGGVQITARWKNDRAPERGRLNVGHLITIPERYAIDLTTQGGSIAVLDDVRGETVIRTSGGSVALKNVEGSADIQTSGGAIAVNNVAGDANAVSSGGSIRLGAVSGHLETRTS